MVCLLLSYGATIQNPIDLCNFLKSCDQSNPKVLSCLYHLRKFVEKNPENLELAEVSEYIIKASETNRLNQISPVLNECLPNVLHHVVASYTPTLRWLSKDSSSVNKRKARENNEEENQASKKFKKT